MARSTYNKIETHNNMVKHLQYRKRQGRTLARNHLNGCWLSVAEVASKPRHQVLSSHTSKRERWVEEKFQVIFLTSNKLINSSRKTHLTLKTRSIFLIRLVITTSHFNMLLKATHLSYHMATRAKISAKSEEVNRKISRLVVTIFSHPSLNTIRKRILRRALPWERPGKEAQSNGVLFWHKTFQVVTYQGSPKQRCARTLLAIPTKMKPRSRCSNASKSRFPHLRFWDLSITSTLLLRCSLSKERTHRFREINL